MLQLFRLLFRSLHCCGYNSWTIPKVLITGIHMCTELGVHCNNLCILCKYKQRRGYYTELVITLTSLHLIIGSKVFSTIQCTSVSVNCWLLHLCGFVFAVHLVDEGGAVCGQLRWPQSQCFRLSVLFLWTDVHEPTEELRGGKDDELRHEVRGGKEDELYAVI